MKKNTETFLKSILFSVSLLSAVTVGSRIVATTKPNTNNLHLISKKDEIYSSNPTIQCMVMTLKDRSQEYIDEYLNFPDRQWVITTPKGGIASYWDPDYIGPVGSTVDDQGNQIIFDLNSKDAATVGEIKKAINEYKSNN